MKKSIYLLVFLALFMSFHGYVNAEKVKYTHEGKYFYVDKSSCSKEKVADSEVYKCKINDDYWLHGIGRDSTTAFLYTSIDDAAIASNEKWWDSLRVCTAQDTSWNGDGGKVYIEITTNSIDYASMTSEGNGLWGSKDFFTRLFGGSLSKCYYYNVEGVDAKNLVIDTCGTYKSYWNNIQDAANSYLSDDPKYNDKAKYKNEYKNNLNILKNLCDQILSSSDYQDSCTKRCLQLKDDIKTWNEDMEIGTDGECGFSKNLIAWVLNIMNWVKYIIPVAVILLGIVDFIKAVASEKDEEMKKAQGRFVKRIIAAALIYLVPLIIEFILNIFGFDVRGCGIIDL